MSNEIKFQVDPTSFCPHWLYEVAAGVELISRGLRHTFYARFGCPAQFPSEISDRRLVASEVDSKGRPSEELREWNRGMIAVVFERPAGRAETLAIHGYFASREEALECLSVISRLLPPEIDRSRADAAVVNFWHAGNGRGEHGAKRESHSIAAPAWDMIAANYPASLRAQIDQLMALSAMPEQSRLMLWRGLPGTGKTWAIRALAREWSSWCKIHYVIDPQVLFSNSNYMLNLLSRLDEVNEGDRDACAKCVVLEDAGELIAMDSRQQYGQALAKLLNLTDGLFGQGLGLMILITTNEDVRNLHPAVVRNGRCLTNLEFGEFSEAEAREWLAAHTKNSCALPAKRTLSDLYAASCERESITNITPQRVAGFTAR
jgi:ATPase family associated with various cellular activities (AAA)